MIVRLARSAARLRAIPAGAATLFAGLILANFAAWLWAFALFADRPAILGTALLAWVFGLRHAVDADHIAAIDNVVRKLIHSGDTPHAVGLYFSLGHSTVVAFATTLLGVAAVGLRDSESVVRAVGSLIGTSVSATFLLLIAAIIWSFSPAYGERSARSGFSGRFKQAAPSHDHSHRIPLSN